jgi:hypothetical protein
MRPCVHFRHALQSSARDYDSAGVQSSFGCSEVSSSDSANSLHVPGADKELCGSIPGGEPSSLYLCAFQTVC